MSRFAELTHTEDVRAVQAEQGAAEAAARRLRGADGTPDLVGPAEREFIESLDGFYLATANEHGWPYIQYKGGPPGFVHVLGESMLAMADVRGNRQYLSTGNLRQSDKVALFFMNYAARTRLKVLGRARTVDAATVPEVATVTLATRTEGLVERLLLVEIEGLAWNCSKHITQRFTLAEVEEGITELRARLAVLERENQELRGRLSVAESAPSSHAGR